MLCPCAGVSCGVLAFGIVTRAEVARMNASARLELPSWTGTTHQPQISSTPPHAFRALWFVCKPRATPAGHKKARRHPWTPRSNGPTVRMGKMAVDLCANAPQPTRSKLTGILIGIRVDSGLRQGRRPGVVLEYASCHYHRHTPIRD